MYPLCSRARWYGIAARLKDSLSDEMSERRLLIDSGMFLIITGGWLDLVWIYRVHKKNGAHHLCQIISKLLKLIAQFLDLF